MRILGGHLSPYVRKVLVCLDLKGIPYEIDPIVPFYGDERFAKLSPLRRVPVLLDGEVALADSTVICEYLEDRHPEPALRPAGAADRARARWLEEFADTRLGDVFIWRLFHQVVTRPAVFGEARDRELVERTLARDVPEVLDYLEGELPAEGFLFGSLGIADVSIAAFFRNAAFARFAIDAVRWPRTAAFVTRVLAAAPFQKLAELEDRLIRTPIPQHRKVLTELGVRLTEDTLFVATPRRGVMPI